MKTTIMYRIAGFAFALLAAVTLLTGCSDDEEKDYRYAITLKDYSYSSSGSGSSFLGPMEYLETLHISDRLTISASGASGADAAAVSRFESEMSKIDPQALARYGKYYFRYVLISSESGKTLAEKEFGSKQ